MKNKSLVFLLLVVILLFASCGSPKIENVSAKWNSNNLVVSFQYNGDKDASAEIIVSDADGIRVRKTVSLSSILNNDDNSHAKLYVVSIPKRDVGYGFYDTGTITVVIKEGDKTFQGVVSVSLPMKKPDDFTIVSAYIKDAAYVVRVRAQTADGEDAVLGKTLKIYIGDMSGRQLFLGTFDVFRHIGFYEVKIPAAKIKRSYTRDILIKAKLEDFNKSDYVQRRAIAYEPISKLSVSLSGSLGKFSVHICPIVKDRKVPVVGKVYISVSDSGYKLFSNSLNVSYQDFEKGCYTYYLPEDIRYSPTGKAIVHVTLKYEKGEIAGKTQIAGLKIATIPEDVKVSFDRDDSGVNINVCAYKQGRKVPVVGKIIFSLYDGKRQLFKDTFDVDGEPCISKYFSYKALGPTTGGKAKVYVTLQPKFGNSLKTSSTLSGLMVKIYKVGYYYAGSLAARMKVVVSDAKFIRDKYDKQKYYFGVYVTITNIGYKAAYVPRYTFNAIDSLGDILDSTYVGVSGEYDGGNIYPGYSRRGWIYFEIPDGIDITKIRYVKIGFRNIGDEWNTLVTIPVYDYMFQESQDYTDA